MSQERMCQTYSDRADEVARASENVGKNDAKENGHDPSAHEALNRLLRRDLDELSPAKGDAADIGPDIVGDDERGGQEEPNKPFKDVVHDEVRLHDDEVKRHMRPGELRELELVVASLEGRDKENEACCADMLANQSLWQS